MKPTYPPSRRLNPPHATPDQASHGDPAAHHPIKLRLSEQLDEAGSRQVNLVAAAVTRDADFGKVDGTPGPQTGSPFSSRLATTALRARMLSRTFDLRSIGPRRSLLVLPLVM